MNRLYVLKAFERTRKSALRVSSSVVPSSSTSGRFWSRSNAFSSSFLREQERDELSRTTNGKERTSGETETERSVRRRKEEPQNKFLESLRRETVKNLEEEQHVSNAKEEEDFKPPTRAFSLREKTFRETRGEELNRLLPKEINGPRGLEPTRFKDWEVGGRCTDF
ncbi:unnamed protein product [Bathycoccus prasinos]